MWAGTGEKTAAALVPLPQNRIKYPRLYRSGVIVGQKRLHATRMAHNDENAAEMGGANRGKVPQPGWSCGDEAELSAFEAAMEDGLGGEMPIANK